MITSDLTDALTRIWLRCALHRAGWRADISRRPTIWIAPDGKRMSEQVALREVARMEVAK